MIWTCKNHDSRVHNYRIHYMSLCILLKLSYIMCGSKLVRELKNWFGHLMSFQQESSHFCNQNTFNLQDWLAFIACWSLIKIFCQNKMLNICWFQNNKKTKARHVSLKDEMWSQNKMQNSNNMIDCSSPFLNQFFWQYLRFVKHFRSTCHSENVGGNIANDTLLHRLHLSLAHQLSDSILTILETVHLKWLRTPPWHHISYLDYTT